MRRNFLFVPEYICWSKLKSVPKHKISYLEWGDPENDNIVICAHGLTRNASDFSYLAKNLKDRFRIISIDYPGRGESDYFTDKSLYDYVVYIKDSLKILKALKIENPFWIGTSMGGIIGMALASKYPDLLKGLVLNDIGPFIPGGSVSKIQKYAGQEVFFDNAERAKEHFKFIYNKFGIKKEADWDYLTKNSIVKVGDKYKPNFDPAAAGTKKKSVGHVKKDVILWPMWKKVAPPVLAVRGEKSDILSEDTVKKMSETKEFELYRVKDAGHAPALVEEKDVLFIKNWLESKI